MATGTIVGVVRDPHGAVLAGAVVTVGGDSPPHRDIAAVTDAGGRFRLERLLPGEYTLVVRDEGGAEATATVGVAAGTAATVDVELAGRSRP